MKRKWFAVVMALLPVLAACYVSIAPVAPATQDAVVQHGYRNY